MERRAQGDRRRRKEQTRRTQYRKCRRRVTSTHLRRAVRALCRHQGEPHPLQGRGARCHRLAGGSVQALCDNVGTVRAFVQSGKVKALAVSTRQRAQALPDVPTFEEQGLAGVDFSLWFMLVAPAGTPEEVVTRLNTEINAILKQPDVIRTLQDNGSEAAGGSVAEASEFLAKENRAWPELVRSIGLTRQ
ncbi:hypothetical protein C2U31_22775 [Achromobacter sp. AONIH1]|nr:hypothetical protein C2U31_22775 [Achromobacter sp. AONIH1]